jgi:transposase
VVLDNANFHSKERLTTLVENANRLIFLPPYSPDLNPIEHFWNLLKNKIRDIAHQYDSLGFATMTTVNLK